MATLDLAIAIAAEAFKGKFDRGGQPYILHCLYVMYGMPEDDQELRIIAVLHDLLEDFPEEWNIIKLKRLGFSNRVLTGLAFLTHDKHTPYDEYIDEMIVAECIDAIRVKLRDLEHNSQVSRVKGLRQKDFERLEKYVRSYTKLKKFLKKYMERNCKEQIL